MMNHHIMNLHIVSLALKIQVVSSLNLFPPSHECIYKIQLYITWFFIIIIIINSKLVNKKKSKKETFFTLQDET